MPMDGAIAKLDPPLDAAGSIVSPKQAIDQV
jgi:hypothetical protein